MLLPRDVKKESGLCLSSNNIDRINEFNNFFFRPPRFMERRKRKLFESWDPLSMRNISGKPITNTVSKT